MRSPAVKRLMKEAQELRDPTELFYAQPLDDNLFEWHFTIRGPGDTEFDGGIFHGRIVLPPDYPMKPPSIIILTPNGRFEVNKKICLSISGHHPESWQPSWSIRTTLLAIIGFMPTHGAGAIGSLDYTPDERKILSKKSLSWKCSVCGNVSDILKPLTDASKETSQEAKALASQINFQGEKGEKSNNGKVSSPTTSTAPLSSLPNSSTSQSTTNNSSPGATATNTTTSSSTATTASAATLPQMMFPSAMNPGGIPAMFPQMPPFLPPMAGQFPFPYRFPYPPVNNDSNSMPCNLMMPPFPNPFLPPMFPAGFTLPPTGNPESQTSSNNVPPSFPFPFMPAPPTVPVSSNPTPVVSSNLISSSSTTPATNSLNKGPSTSSSTRTSTSPSTSSATSTTANTSTSKAQAQSDGSASTSGASQLSKDPSVASARDKNTLLSTSSSSTSSSPPLPPPPSSSSSDASKAAKTNSEDKHKSTETANSAAETSTAIESGLRHRVTAVSSGASTATANSDQPSATMQPTATPAPERAGQSRSTPSFVLMVILGAAILLLCLRRLYISTDHLPYPDYQH